ncbi:DNA adenine methylase [Ventosimonas gracilis]|uniref:Site-specific DNA-methyltransferase (adenine-specific) n=1 Tax=Ventosimonas gracilis TaxID=1680762 RepID=A0A139SUS7_9GAMM|nr:Dam family site-specific DNA-(adenine-N6)-methyltransferase [Ventosimonas gracilis]KXU38335.1 DNA adenine methylase [Ventosimonas gracilis]
MKTQKAAHTLPARPVLKWAGGKTQLLDALRTHLPKKFNRYIEPFVGGGALFFDLNPRPAVIADLNPELINLYQCLQRDYLGVVKHLPHMPNDEDFFYNIRALEFADLEPMQAAARTIYLNRTCYNGLYRVNKKGQFNVPFGHYRNPAIFQPECLQAAAQALAGTTIILGNYKDVLEQHARSGDFVFLDPPYLPVGEYADFKRYTKEQFYEEDHRELAEEVRRLQKIGCHVILTNSNHPLVHELYAGLEMEVISTRRSISSRAATRKGEDVIITARPAPQVFFRLVPDPVPEQAGRYPSTRYMGSKEKLLPWIKSVAQNFEFDSVADLFSGSGSVGYMFKSMGKQVFSNDYMTMNATLAKAMIENSTQTLTPREIDQLFSPNTESDRFVQDTFQGIYYPDKENAVIDLVRANIRKFSNPHKRAIALSALIRACLKKRARGIFTYTGMRYDDGRTDLALSMETQIRRAVAAINAAVFDNGIPCAASSGDAMQVQVKADLVYLDPPYYSPLSDNEYVRRYHFVEGLARDWKGVEIQWHTKTRKFKSYPTPFSSRVGAADAFDRLFRKLKDSIIMLSYSSNSLPTKDEIIHLLTKYKRHVEVVDIDHRYSFANQGSASSEIRNQVKEYLFVGF